MLSFERLLVRNRSFDKRTIDGYLNFTQIMRKLLKLKYKNVEDSSIKEDILRDIKGHSAFFNKLWVSQKMDEL